MEDIMIIEQKEQFPEQKDIEWIMVKVPEWFFGDRANGLISNQKYNCVELSSWAITSTVYNEMKKVHENSKDFKVTWQLKQTDQHTEIKAEYEEALKKYDVVRVFYKPVDSDGWKYAVGEGDTIFNLSGDWEFIIKCYNIDWNKLLSWSYANGEFVECEFSNTSSFGITFNRILYGVNDYWFITANGLNFKYCRIAPHVTIKNEWLKEIK